MAEVEEEEITKYSLVALTDQDRNDSLRAHTVVQ